MAERFEPRSVARLTVALLLLVLTTWAWSYVPGRCHTESHGGQLFLISSERPIPQYDSSSNEFQGFTEMMNWMRGEAPRYWRWHGLGFAFYMGDFPMRGPDSDADWVMNRYVTLVVPYWSLASIAGLVATVALLRVWRRKRAEFHGHCLSCGYDLRFSRDRCPECGSLVPEQEATQDAAA